MNKKITIIVIAIIIAIATIGFFVWQKYYKAEPAPTPSPVATEKPQTLGGEISEQVQNPAEKLPETNPYEAKTNPFEEAKTNPFEDIYKNPFGE